jgi:hypothetical protein
MSEEVAGDVCESPSPEARLESPSPKIRPKAYPRKSTRRKSTPKIFSRRPIVWRKSGENRAKRISEIDVFSRPFCALLVEFRHMTAILLR